MSYQIRPLFYQIQRVLKQAHIDYDPLLPTQIKTVSAVNRLQPRSNAFVGIAILPGRINTLIRPKTFVVETTKIVADNFVITYSVVVMDDAGDLRLVEGLAIDHTDLDGLDAFVNSVADLVEEQDALNHTTPTPDFTTRSLLASAALHIANIAKPRWAGWIIYVLEVLQDHAEPIAYNVMLTELSLAIEVRQLQGSW